MYKLCVCDEIVNHSHGSDTCSYSYEEWTQDFSTLKAAIDHFISIQGLGTMGAIEHNGQTVKVF